MGDAIDLPVAADRRSVVDLSRLPQVDALLQRSEAIEPIGRFGRRAFTRALRQALDDCRADARRGTPVPLPAEIVGLAVEAIEAQRDRRLTRVVNATGVVLHTNLGRAPLSAAARAAVNEAAGYTTLEYDLAAGRRGSRTVHVGELAAELCGTEAATVVNNGAAALVLVLAALATGKDVIVSRGELIEIGGAFRLPDIMAASGAVLQEVGTTNRTRVGDYRAALDDDTGLVLKVHQSNYEVVGFAESAPVKDLVELAREAGVPLAYDLGSGLVRDHDGLLVSEPSVAAAVADGADLVIFSGDKLLGGPQAGIIAGRADFVMRCTSHPLARALRIDKLQRAALEATLEAHLRTDAPAEVPLWAMLQSDPDALRDRAHQLAQSIGDPATAEPSRALIGGGSAPGADLASWCVTVAAHDAEALAQRLRDGATAVVGRVEEGRLVLDLLTVPPAQDGELAALVRHAVGAE